jgi:triosephosphate isomerase (TIM)
MKKQYFFVANWKMNLNIDEELNFASLNYDKLINLTNIKSNILVLCPSFISLYPINQIFKETQIKIGAQNCSQNKKGAFTSQISAESLSAIGCKYCIIGHSESRKYFSETDKQISQKFTQLINYKISPILCIGESSNEYEQQKVFEVLDKQLKEVLNNIKKGLLIPNNLPICIAYEPIWAIGTGKAISIDHLETILAYLLNKLQKENPQINWKIFYGGSLNSQNTPQLKKIENLDGFLVGGSSLDFQEFEKIVKYE